MLGGRPTGSRAGEPASANRLVNPRVNRPEDLGFAPDRLRRLTQAFQAFVEDGRLPGAVVLIARDNRVTYLQAFGYRDQTRKLPMTADAIFRIASMTKPITTAAIMTSVEQGKIDLGAPVFRYLPELKDLRVGVERPDPATGKTELILEPPKRPMIVQDLLRHTAGLVYGHLGDGLVHKAYRDADLRNDDQTLAEMVAKLSKLPLANQPGEVWEYSMAVDVLGRIIETVSGMPLDQFIEERIARPLGMSSTGFHVRPADRDRIAQPADAASMTDPTHKPRWLSGASGGVSTAGDYLRFCEMLLNGGKLDNTRLLSPASVALMTSNALPPGIRYAPSTLQMEDVAPMPALGQGFGFGFAVRTEAGINPLPGSVGSFYWTGGTGTTFFVDPKQRLIIVMMTQVPLEEAGTYRRLVRYLAYQALTDRIR
jgi:CubicO group peptidase (beta-lactamase class C family)